MIKRAAVIGAGTMGAGIAAQLANAGVECLLLDIVPSDVDGANSDAKARSKLAIEAIERMRRGKAGGFMLDSDYALVVPGNIEDDLGRIAECDWVIEAVTERLDVKRSLYEQLTKHRRPGTIISSNTSGLALNLLTEGMDDDFRQHFLITHFFNPPRYMYLLEIVRGPETSADVLREVESFCDLRLGKGIVRCKDTPNFIANRIGVYVMGVGTQFMLEEGLTVEEVDAITGPLMGRPKTASFRLQDLVGIDISVMVMQNAKNLLSDDESLSRFEIPDLLTRLVEEGRLGRKSGAGFYKKEGKEILVLDTETFEYRPQREVQFPSLDAARAAGGGGKALAALLNGDDPASRYAWRLLAETLLYSARRMPEIAGDVVSVDRAMRWGFNWSQGPFETWDAIGVRSSTERMVSSGEEVPAWIADFLEQDNESFYKFLGEGSARRQAYFDIGKADYTHVPASAGTLLLTHVRSRSEPVESSKDASIWELEDGVLGVEFHSKLNSISDESLAAIQRAIDLAEEGDYAGVVVGNQAANFSVGANLKMLSTLVAEQNWFAVDEILQSFQRTTLRMRYATKPVVAAVQGMALGGGCEIAIGGCHIQAAAESYMGLVEMGVGLIPAGGGTREFACRAHERTPEGAPTVLFPFVQEAFDTIAQAKTSTSAADARRLGFLRPGDGISMNKDRALQDACRSVRTLAESGYRAPRTRDGVRVAGRLGWSEFKIILRQYQAGAFISDYDVHVATKFAYALCGGDIDDTCRVSEQCLLNLEREVFLSLLGEEKTQERIAHTLKTGKPLRN